MELGSGFFPRGINFVAVLPNVHHFFREHRPAKEIVERGDVGSPGIDLRDAGNSAEFVFSTVLKGDGGALVGNDRLRRVDNGLQDPFQVQRRGDLVADGHQHFEDLHFALSQQ